jgi:hypothetical protein
LADNATIRLPNGVLVSRRADGESIDYFVDRCCAAGRSVVSPPMPDEISLYLEAVYQARMAAWETRKYCHEPNSFATYVPLLCFCKKPEYPVFSDTSGIKIEWSAITDRIIIPKKQDGGDIRRPCGRNYHGYNYCRPLVLFGLKEALNFMKSTLPFAAIPADWWKIKRHWPWIGLWPQKAMISTIFIMNWPFMGTWQENNALVKIPHLKQHPKESRQRIDYKDKEEPCGCFRLVWYVPPNPGDCARSYILGAPGGRWRLYSPKRKVGRIERNIVSIMGEGDKLNGFIEEIDISPDIPVRVYNLVSCIHKSYKRDEELSFDRIFSRCSKEKILQRVQYRAWFNFKRKPGAIITVPPATEVDIWPGHLRTFKKKCYEKQSLPDNIDLLPKDELLIYPSQFRYYSESAPKSLITWDYGEGYKRSGFFPCKLYIPIFVMNPYAYYNPRLYPSNEECAQYIYTCDEIFERTPVYLQLGSSLIAGLIPRHDYLKLKPKDLLTDYKKDCVHDFEYSRSAWPLQEFFKYHGLEHPGRETKIRPPFKPRRLPPVCDECDPGQYPQRVYEPIHNEMVCTACGLTDEIQPPKYDQKRKKLDGPNGRPIQRQTDALPEPKLPELRDISVSNEEETPPRGDDDDRASDMLQNGNYLGGYEKPKDIIIDDHAPIQEWGGKASDHLFTHKAFKRCLRKIQHPSIECLAKCIYPDKKSCIKCEYAISTSLKNREHSYISESGDLPNELSYQKICFETLLQIPYINPAMVASDRSWSRFLENAVKPNLEWASVNLNRPDAVLEGPTSAPSVKKRRENPSTHWDARSYVVSLNEDPRILYRGTALANLLEKAPDPGSHALWILHEYARLDEGPNFKYERGLPTVKNLKKCFACQRQDENRLNYSIGNDYYNKLVKYDVLKLLKRRTTNEILYYPENNKLPVPGKLGSHNTEPNARDKQGIKRISDYIAEQRKKGTKKIMFSAIGKACKISEARVERLILDYPGTLKIRKTLAVLQARKKEVIRKPVGIVLR